MGEHCGGANQFFSRRRRGCDNRLFPLLLVGNGQDRMIVNRISNSSIENRGTYPNFRVFPMALWHTLTYKNAMG
jgi:hypothetical protein